MKSLEFIPRCVQEWRRLRALALKEQGWSPREIAEVLDVAEETANRWMARARVAGADALRSRPAQDRPPQLSVEQVRLIPGFLSHGPEGYGFRGQVWARARVARVIEEDFVIRFHKMHVGRLLTALRWTPLTPISRTIQRDEAAIER